MEFEPCLNGEVSHAGKFSRIVQKNVVGVCTHGTHGNHGHLSYFVFRIASGNRVWFPAKKQFKFESPKKFAQLGHHIDRHKLLRVTDFDKKNGIKLKEKGIRFAYESHPFLFVQIGL
ncbi:MAG: hypothetical protein ACD_67C00243G0002 [uncultured bacterium]|nr:MAG: hypothetical protein ACD_67C00243G0002 [uncultured bacterium]